MADSAVHPSEVARQKFDLERRGFDQAQVRTYLIAVADALRDAQTREAEIRTRLGKAIRRAEKAEASVREAAPRDPSELNRQVGDEVAAVLDAARVAGEQKVAAAEKSADQLMANAKSEATQIRQAAETILDERRAEADAEAEQLLATRRAEAEQLVATAQSDAEILRKDAADDVARTRDECAAMIQEAEEARARILQDMERRRRQARAQVERLRVGRDRLLRSYDVVRRTLDESTSELKSSLKEAKVLGDTAARTSMAEPLREPAQLEAELADARLISQPKRSKKPASPARDGGPASGADGTPSVQVPHVDMRPGAFTEETAPTPKRPVVGTNPSATSNASTVAVPRPPAVAPTIKRPDTPTPPAASPDGGGARVGDAATVDDSTPEAQRGALAVLPVPSIDAELIETPTVDAVTEEPATDVAEAVEAAEVVDAAEEADVAEEAEAAEAVDVVAEAAESVDVVEDVEAAESVDTAETLEEPRVMRTETPTDDVGSAEGTEADEPGAGGADVESVTGDGDGADQEAVDFSDLPTEELAIIVASDEIEQVVAVVADDSANEDGEPRWIPVDATDTPVADDGDADSGVDDAQAEPAVADLTQDEASNGLFAALRQQTGSEVVDEVAAADEIAPEVVDEVAAADEIAPEVVDEVAAADGIAPADEDAAPSFGEPAEMARQRAAVIAAVTTDLEKRLKRALADEQNDVLAGLRAAGRRRIDLISLVGETDDQVQRYVGAMHEVAAQAYGAGAALVDAEAEIASMPAGAVEEIVGSAIVLPIRLRLIELDSIDVDRAVAHLDAVRAFYRQRKTDHLGEVAETLAGLLVTAGACDSLPAEAALPWLVGV